MANIQNNCAYQRSNEDDHDYHDDSDPRFVNDCVIPTEIADLLLIMMVIVT